MAHRSPLLARFLVLAIALFGAHQAFLPQMTAQRPSRNGMELQSQAVQGAAVGVITALGGPTAAHAEGFLGFIDWNTVWATNVILAVGLVFAVPVLFSVIMTPPRTTKDMPK